MSLRPSTDTDRVARVALSMLEVPAVELCWRLNWRGLVMILLLSSECSTSDEYVDPCLKSRKSAVVLAVFMEEREATVLLSASREWSTERWEK